MTIFALIFRESIDGSRSIRTRRRLTTGIHTDYNDNNNDDDDDDDDDDTENVTVDDDDDDENNNHADDDGW